MIHLGDITKLHGDAIPPVDCITGGSPCQDLSVAGKRAGLAGERSGLFMEQIRIVKEMRERDRRAGRTAWAVRPRFMVWENVPGAFSSNKGEDFRAVLEEIVKVVEPDAPPVPLPDKGKWPKSGCLYSDLGDWSLSYRVHDAQFWGVPQRRKRIALVADFGGLAAPEVLFEREGLSRDSEPCGTAREAVAGATGSGFTSASAFTYRGRENGFNVEMQDELAYAPRNPSGGGSQPNVLISAAPTESRTGDASIDVDVFAAGFSYGQSAKARSLGYEEELSPTLRGGEGGNQKPCVLDAREPLCIEMTSTKNTVVEDGVSPTLTARMGTGGNQVNALCMDVGFFSTEEEKSGALLARRYKDPPIVVKEERQTVGTLCAESYPGKLAHQDVISGLYPLSASVIRRLTPLECERLQGFPDGWTDIGDWVDSKGKKHKAADSPRYKALGNSIALPFWFWLLRRISAQYERPATLGSLFDGIGGFPLCWERCSGKGTAIWASEIEEFPIAVTKVHFPEETQT